MGQKITYLLGAGASCNSYPVLNELGDRMIHMKHSFETGADNNLLSEASKKFLQEIHDIGNRAIDFNTIDTYAKRLYLLGKHDELKVLKRALNVFMTLWDIDVQPDWKKFKKDRKIYNIDPRYISLMATYLEKGAPFPKLNEDIRFVVWNYDLQLENAYHLFCDFDGFNCHAVNNHFRFLPFSRNERRSPEMVVCHLNGVHGFWGEDPKANFYSLISGPNNKITGRVNVLNKICEMEYSDIPNMINFAWEDAEISEDIRTNASNILSATEILIIIGYSFPPFNYSIDKQLFDAGRTSIKKVIYQDPKASADILMENFGVPKQYIQIVKEEMGQFVISNYQQEPPEPVVLDIREL